MAAAPTVLLRRCVTRPYFVASTSALLLPTMANPKNTRQFPYSVQASGDRRATSSPTQSTSFPSTPQSRLSLISRHLQDHNTLQLNTPYSTERQSSSEKDFDAAVPQLEKESNKPAANMSAQEPHPTVLIPGPIEYDDEVLKSMSHYRYVSLDCPLNLTAAQTSAASPTSAHPL